jgi:hypothetical protein
MGTTIDLEAAVASIARQLLPGWRITSKWCAAKAMPAGVLVSCNATPTRMMASLAVASPWPADRDITEELWAALAEAFLSPLTELVVGGGSALESEACSRACR